MITFVYYLAPGEKIPQQISRDEISRFLAEGKGLLWVDIEGTSSEDAQFLTDVFLFHPLAVADCVSKNIHPPKIDQFEDHLFVIVHGINYQTESDLVETAELALFLGKNYVVTSHEFPSYSVRAIQHNVEEDGRLMRRSADFLAHAVVDALADNVMPTIDRMSDVTEEIEDEVIRNPQQTTLDGIMKLKRSSLRVHRVMAPQREVFNRLSRGEFPQIKKEAQIFYRNVYDHIVRIEDLNQTILDRADNALATYLSAVANRQNETMRILSIVATIFLPLTLVAAIYGMNFDYMPELRWRWGYFAVLGLIALVILMVMWRFWASGWFGWGRRRIAWVKPFIVENKKIRGYFIPNRKRGKQQSDSEI